MRLEELLVKSKYPPDKTQFLVQGFASGFSIGFEGDSKVRRLAPNLKLRIGIETILWNKVMKEVKIKCFAGPFAQPPFEHFIQSPIGLVPKDQGKATFLIFHLSYPRNGDSVNSQTPADICKVKYCEFDDAVRWCLEEGVGCFVSKSDMMSAFRNLGIKKSHWSLLMLKARSPFDKKWYFFIDKCLPFGSSISCAHFQAFSNAVAHIVQFLIKRKVINYLDDFLFAALLKWMCNQQVQCFLDICALINFPVSLEKTFWGSTCMVFLGLLIDTVRQLVCVPPAKVEKAKVLIQTVLSKRKVTLHDLQKFCGFLNFLCRAVVPGRAFTRRLYAKTAGVLKPHHHIQITREMHADLTTWLEFLNHPTAYCRPFMDFREDMFAQDVDFSSDASKNFKLGMGAICQNSWMFMQWEDELEQLNPSIEYLELFALAAAVLAWISRFRNRRVFIFCDNMSVVHMINNSSSSCRNCMVPIRLITFETLCQNVRIFAKHVRSEDNGISDALSRLDFKRFRNLTAHKNLDAQPTEIPVKLLPIARIWLKN